MASPKFKAGFSGGELDPRFRDRVTTAIHQNSLQKGKNMMATKGGSLRPRYSTEHVMTLGKDKTKLKLFPMPSRNLFFEVSRDTTVRDHAASAEGVFVDPFRRHYIGNAKIAGDVYHTDISDPDPDFHRTRFGDAVYKDAIDPVVIFLDESLIGNSTVLNEVSTSNFLLTGNSSRANINYVVDNFIGTGYDIFRDNVKVGTPNFAINSGGDVTLSFYLSASRFEVDGVELINKTIVDYILVSKFATVTLQGSYEIDLQLPLGTTAFSGDFFFRLEDPNEIGNVPIDVYATQNIPSLTGFNDSNGFKRKTFTFSQSQVVFTESVLVSKIAQTNNADFIGFSELGNKDVPNGFYGRSITPYEEGRVSNEAATVTTNKVQYAVTLVQNGIESPLKYIINIVSVLNDVETLQHLFNVPTSSSNSNKLFYAFDYPDFSFVTDTYGDLPDVDFIRFYRRPLPASPFSIHLETGGAFGFIGEVSVKEQNFDPNGDTTEARLDADTDDDFKAYGAVFEDIGGDPDFTNNPPKKSKFLGLKRLRETAPTFDAATYAQQRLFIARGNALEASQIQGPFVETSPLTSASALSTLVGDDYPAVRYLHNSKWGLLVFTDRGIYINNGTFALENLGFEKAAENEVIQKDLPPLKALDSVYYFSQTTNSVMALTYSRETQSIRSVNISWMSDHIFRDKKIVSWDILAGENPQVIAVFSDGTFATRALEGDPDGERGWFPHSMAHDVKQVLTLDLVTYIVVQKEDLINGETHFFLEKFITESNENYLLLMDGAVNLDG